MRQAQRRLLRLFGRAQRPAAWLLLLAATVTFFGVLANLITLGNARLGTLLISADLMVSGYAALVEVENEAEEGGEVQ